MNKNRPLISSLLQALVVLASFNAYTDVLTIADVDALIEKNTKAEYKGPLLDQEVDLNSNTSRFSATPLGAYLNILIPGPTPTEQIKTGSAQIVESVASNRFCQFECSESFKKQLANERQKVVGRLDSITQSIASNEITNEDRFSVFYHAFSNEFRLYQDVLRALKSFEFLTKLSSTYPFRDFPFKGARTTIPSFLHGWWNAYLEHAKNDNKPPFPGPNHQSKAAGVGLTYFPDSILYAQKHVLSANVNFFGNNLSVLNSSAFFFLISTTATGAGIDKVNELVKLSLKPYLLKKNGELDEAKFAKVAQELKTIFEKYMGNAGGQVAQIFVDKSATPKVAYMAWNGGEPLWTSKATGDVIFAKSKQHKTFFRPPNIFWPNAKQRKEYRLFSVVEYMDLFINNPTELRKRFPVYMTKLGQRIFTRIFENKENKQGIKNLLTMDYSQARVLPAPKFFTDESVTGVKIFTWNPVSTENEKRYNEEIFAVIRDVIGDFLANAQSVSDFKEGRFKLKSAFINAQ